MKYTTLFLFLISLKAIALPTQILWTNETTTAAPGNWRYEMQNQYTLDKRDADVPGASQETAVGVTTGIYESNDIKAETGVDWKEPARSGLIEAPSAHIKASFNDVYRDGWSFALGAHSIGFKSNTNDYNVIYSVFEHHFGGKFKVGAGAYFGSSSLLRDDQGVVDNKGVMLALYQEIQKGRGALTLQFQSGKNKLGYAFAGVHLMLREHVASTLGLGLVNNRNSLRDLVLFKLSVDVF